MSKSAQSDPAYQFTLQRLPVPPHRVERVQRPRTQQSDDVYVTPHSQGCSFIFAIVASALGLAFATLVS
ncbi:hypothetical protein [Rhodopirellula europaea]|uniref:hypothetical protein n=1 Tax=Rhodopirellula europaea TaxID=1263866 RepID=UPI003D27C8A8